MPVNTTYNKKKTPFKHFRWSLFISIVIITLSCDSINNTIKPWTGPLITTYNAKTLLSDSAKVKVRVYGNVAWQYKNNNLTYPKGVIIELFDDGKKQTRLVADSAFLNSETQTYTALGNVVMNNYVKKITLKTDKLTWNRVKKKVISDTDVSITQKNQKIYGCGFEAFQDLKRWKILKVKGIIPLQTGN